MTSTIKVAYIDDKTAINGLRTNRNRASRQECSHSWDAESETKKGFTREIRHRIEKKTWHFDETIQENPYHSNEKWIQVAQNRSEGEIDFHEKENNAIAHYREKPPFATNLAPWSRQEERVGHQMHYEFQW